jgi:hypothetical protein
MYKSSRLKCDIRDRKWIMKPKEIISCANVIPMNHNLCISTSKLNAMSIGVREKGDFGKVEYILYPMYRL